MEIRQAPKREIGSKDSSLGFASISMLLSLLGESMEHEKRRQVATACYWICLHSHKGLYLSVSKRYPHVGLSRCVQGIPWLFIFCKESAGPW